MKYFSYFFFLIIVTSCNPEPIFPFPKKNISIKVLTGERPLVKRAQLEGKTIVVKKFNVFTKKVTFCFFLLGSSLSLLRP